MRVDVVSRASFTCAGGVSGPDFTRARVWCGEVLDVGRMARDYGPGSERLVLGCRAQSVLLLRTVGVVWGARGPIRFQAKGLSLPSAIGLVRVAGGDSCCSLTRVKLWF